MACGNGVCVRYGFYFNGQKSDNQNACIYGFHEQVEQLNGHKLPDFLCHAAPTLIPKSEENPNLCSGPDDFCTYESKSPVTM
jgi:hypothetical protein